MEPSSRPQRPEQGARHDRDDGDHRRHPAGVDQATAHVTGADGDEQDRQPGPSWMPVSRSSMVADPQPTPKRTSMSDATASRSDSAAIAEPDDVTDEHRPRWS
jgi:hypothetical protein